MTSLADYAAAHRIAYDELASVIASLDDDQLATQSLCPDWDVRACVAHAIGIDKALTGWVPDPENLFDFAIAARFMEEAVSMSPDEFASAVAAIADARVTDLESLDPSVVDEPSMTPLVRRRTATSCRSGLRSVGSQPGHRHSARYAARRPDR